MPGPAGALLMLVAGALAGQMPPAASQAVPRAWVIDAACRIYEQPDPFSSTVLIAEAGQPYRVLAKSGGWYEVLLPDNRTGWMVASHVALSSRGSAGPGRVSGSKGEVWTALGGAVAGGCIGVVPMGAFLAYTLGSLDFSPVHGSGAVSGTTIPLAYSAWVVSGLVVVPASAAYGAFSAGERERPGGNLAESWAAALAGNLAGSLAGFCLDQLFLSAGWAGGPFTWLGSLAGTTAGAVIGYEHSKPPCARHYADARVGPPMVGLSPSRSLSGQVSPALQVGLVTVRF